MDLATQKMAAIGLTSRKLPSYQKAVTQLVEGGYFEVFSVLQSDRESSVVSAKFRKFVMDKYNIKIQYLSKASPSLILYETCR